MSNYEVESMLTVVLRGVGNNLLTYNCWPYMFYSMQKKIIYLHFRNSYIYLSDSLDNVLGFVPCKVLSDIHKGQCVLKVAGQLSVPLTSIFLFVWWKGYHHFFLLLELQVCSVVIVRNWIWRGLPTPSMTSLITSVSDSLQICLLLLTCCQSASQPVNQSTTQSGNFLLWVRQPAGLLLTTLAGGIGERERGRERRGNIKGGGGRQWVEQTNTFMQTHLHLIA